MSTIVETSLAKAAKGTSLIIFGTIISTLLLLASKILVARNTTKEELGAYTLSVAIMSVLALISTLGVHEGIARYVSLFLGKGNIVEADLRSRAALQINLISGTAAGLILYLLSDFLSLSVFKNPQLILPLKAISFSLPFFVMTQTLNSILRGHGIITQKTYCIDIGIPLFFLILLGIVLLLNLSFLSIVYAYVFALILAFIAIAVYGYKQIKLHPFRLYNARNRNELLRFSFPLLIGIVMTVIIKYAGILMLGRAVGPKAVGIYDVGNTLSLLMLFPLSGLEFVFLPIAGTLHSRGQTFELARTYQVLTKWVFSVTAPIFFVLFLFPDQVITTLFSARFSDAAPVLRILCLGSLFHAFWGPNGILMVVIGMSQEISYVSIFGGIVNIVLNYLLISQFSLGIIGAAMACVLTYISLNILVSIIIYKKSGIHPFTKNYFKAFICAAFMGLCVFFASRFMNLHWIFLFFYFALFILGYGLLLFITKSIDAEDVSLLMMFIELVKTKSRTLKGTVGLSND